MAVVLTKRWLLILLLLTSGVYSLAYGEEAKVFRTGLEATKAHVSVSPNGKHLLFDTDRIAHGLRLLNLSNGESRIVPTEPGRTFGFPSWSPDGQHIAVVSAAVRDGFYSVDDMKIVLIDSSTWTNRTIASGEGVKGSPFFSEDGKTVYYFKGIKRESGKTVASRFDLYAIDLTKGQEIRLTHEEIYQMGKGDDDGHKILFSAYGWKRFSSKDPVFGFEQTALFVFDKTTGNIHPFMIDQSSGIFDFREVRRDKFGNLYFVAKKFKAREKFHWFLVRSNNEGKNPEVLTELSISMDFDIARNNGDIYVMDKDGKELIIRKLPTKTAN